LHVVSALIAYTWELIQTIFGAIGVVSLVAQVIMKIIKLPKDGSKVWGRVSPIIDSLIVIFVWIGSFQVLHQREGQREAREEYLRGVVATARDSLRITKGMADSLLANGATRHDQEAAEQWRIEHPWSITSRLVEGDTLVVENLGTPLRSMRVESIVVFDAQPYRDAKRRAEVRYLASNRQNSHTGSPSAALLPRSIPQLGLTRSRHEPGSE